MTLNQTVQQTRAADWNCYVTESLPLFSLETEDKGEAKESPSSCSLDAEIGFLFSLSLVTVRSSAKFVSLNIVTDVTDVTTAPWENRGLQNFPSQP